MKILLDTHMLIWSAAGELPNKAVKYIEDKSNTLLFSSASIWEVAIKQGLGRADFNVDPTALYNGLLMAGYKELPIIGQHTLLVLTLPPLHKDPFDRILIAQSISEEIPLLTSDKRLLDYHNSVIYIA